MEQWLAKINKLTAWQAALIIVVVGFAVHFTGLTSPFKDDDQTQIVNNTPVHSITNIRYFFEGGTFDFGQGLSSHLSGVYYRPLMTTIFSLLYTLFGPHTFPFHLLQLFLCIGSACLIYLFLRYSFQPLLALVLSLVFLVHPINSQVAFAIPTMQDALFLFFGLLAMWLLPRFKTTRSLIGVAVCLFLSLLSKESGVFFVLIAAVYLFWFDRKRLLPFAGITTLPAILWLILKVHAVGLGTNPNNAPIDRVSLASRLFTMPSEGLFYVTKLVFPWKLATGYYWVYTNFSVRHVLLPLLADIIILSLVATVTLVLRQRVSRAMYYTYLFFGVWTALGLITHLQLMPLDMTACETWFCFPMVGVIGMIGVVLVAFQTHLQPSWFLVIAVLVIGVLGFRTAIRGLDWENKTVIAYKDISASPENYAAYSDVARILVLQGRYKEAEGYALHSVNILPTYVNNYNLGGILTKLGDYHGAIRAYNHSLEYLSLSLTYENLAELYVVYGDPTTDSRLFTTALARYPGDSKLLMYLAIIEDEYNDNADAKTYISRAASYGQVPQVLYDNIMNNKSYTLNLYDLGETVKIK